MNIVGTRQSWFIRDVLVLGVKELTVASADRFLTRTEGAELAWAPHPRVLGSTRVEYIQRQLVQLYVSRNT